MPVDIDLLLCKSNNVDEAEAGHGQVKKKKMVVVSSQTIFLVARVKLNGREKKKKKPTSQSDQLNPIMTERG